jgi:hypothetical protein
MEFIMKKAAITLFSLLVITNPSHARASNSAELNLQQKASFEYYGFPQGGEANWAAFMGAPGSATFVPVWQSKIDKYHLDTSTFQVGNGLVRSAEDSLAKIQQKINDPTTKTLKQTAFVFPRAKVEYSDNYLSSTTLVDSKVTRIQDDYDSGYHFYHFNIEFGDRKSLFVETFNENHEFVCSMFFQQNNRKDAYAELTGQNVKECLKSSIKKYLEMATPPASGRFSVIIAKRTGQASTNESALFGLTHKTQKTATFDVMTFYIQLKIQDPIALDDYNNYVLDNQ